MQDKLDNLILVCFAMDDNNECTNEASINTITVFSVRN
jgi:hypothetical protein